MRSLMGLMTRAGSMMMRETSRTGGKIKQKVIKKLKIEDSEQYFLFQTSSWTRPSVSSGSTVTTPPRPSTRSSTGSTPRGRTLPTMEASARLTAPTCAQWRVRGQSRDCLASSSLAPSSCCLSATPRSGVRYRPRSLCCPRYVTCRMLCHVLCHVSGPL